MLNYHAACTIFLGTRTFIPLKVDNKTPIGEPSNQIFAWEASCPNQYPSSCSTMRIDGVQSVCDCDNYKYSLATGQLLSNTENDAYPMKLYFSEKNGNSIRISN